MAEPIDKLMDELSTDSLTVKMLKSLGYFLPGEEKYIVGFDAMIKDVTGSDDPAVIEKVRNRALELYDDKAEGYQDASFLYTTVDLIDKAIGAASLASKAGENISFLSFLSKLTPKPDVTQSIDFLLKLIVEVVCYTKINGLPGASVQEFVDALVKNYKDEALMRVVTLVCVDGLIPLGPDFLMVINDKLGGLSPGDLESNGLFKKISSFIPGGVIADKLAFITNSFEATKGWISNFVESKGISFDAIKGNLGTVFEFTDDKLDYVAAFLDLSTNYFAHTGTQTLARSLITRAYEEV